MSNKNNAKLDLSEALKRYNLLSEYNFYIPRKDDEDNKFKGNETTIDEQETDPVEEIPDVTPTEPVATDTTTTTTDTTTTTTGVETPPQMTTPTTPTDTTGEVEVDVTDIVKDTKETKDAVNSGNQKVDELLTKLNDLEQKLATMNDLVSKIDELENEFEKRNPTPEEKLDMRSLDSFPYNLKLTDYWSEKEGAYDVMNNSKKVQPHDYQGPTPTVEKEYTLTQGEVENDYNEGEVSDSFYPEG